MTEQEIKKIVSDTVRETLIELGIAHDDPIEMQKDFQHLREWRLATAMIRRKSILTLLGLVIAGAAAALWVGFKSMINQ
jgi:hypothetical protein